MRKRPTGTLQIGVSFDFLGHRGALIWSYGFLPHPQQLRLGGLISTQIFLKSNQNNGDTRTKVTDLIQGGIIW